MCEYGVLYVAMLLYDQKLKGDLIYYYGKFGAWEHFCLGYNWKNKDYFIDLTLSQFSKDYPRLAITEYHNERKTGKYSFLSDPDSIQSYVEEFYTNPKNMVKPKLNVFNIKNNYGGWEKLI